MTETKYPENCPYVTGGTLLDCAWKDVLADVDSGSNLDPVVKKEIVNSLMKTVESLLDRTVIEEVVNDFIGALVLIVNLIISLIESLTALLNAIADVIEETRKLREGKVEPGH